MFRKPAPLNTIPSAPHLEDIECQLPPSTPPPSYDSLYSPLSGTEVRSSSHISRGGREIHDGVYVTECNLNEVAHDNESTTDNNMNKQKKVCSFAKNKMEVKDSHYSSYKTHGMFYVGDDSCDLGKYLEYVVLPGLTVEQAKDRFIEKMSDYSYHFGNPWKRLHIQKITSSRVWNYNLLTIEEKRTTVEIESPSSGRISDDYKIQNRPASVWAIEVDIPENLKAKKVRVPGSSTIKKCHRCKGKGYEPCYNCSGKGDISCDHCHEYRHVVVHGSHYATHDDHHGNSHHHDHRHYYGMEYCFHCRGEGKSVCCDCEGKIRRCCSKCKGSGYLEKHTQLKVKWRRPIDDYFSEKCPISDDFLKKCDGEIVYETLDCNGEVEILTTDDCLNHEMVRASYLLTEQRQILATKEPALIRKQKQVVSIIPIHEVEAEWKGKRITYYIAGKNNLCYVPRPLKFSGSVGCTIF